MKKQRTTPVFYDELEHLNAMNEGHKSSLIFKEAKAELEAVLEKPIDDYAEFRKDILGYSITSIKAKFPKAFDLGLPIEKVLAMLSIDLRKIERADAILKTSPHKFCVCPKTGDTTPDEDKEPFTQYAVNDEQHERLDFANELIKLLEKAHTFKTGTNKANLTNGLSHIIYHDPEQGLIPNRFFVLEGIQ